MKTHRNIHSAERKVARRSRSSFERTRRLLLAALRVWELKQRIKD